MSVNHSREILARLASVGPPVILLTAVAAGFIISAQVRSVVIEGAAQTISAGASGLAAPCVDVADGETSFSAQGCEALASAITQRQQAGQVQGYRLLRTDGTVLFSTDQAEIGHVVEIDGLEKAAGGEIDVATVGSESDPLVARVGHRMLRVVTPVRKGEAGAVLAVAESYKPYAPIAASVADMAMVEMQEILNHYRTGLTVVTVKLQNANPPASVKQAFNEVNEAQQEKERMINEAQQVYNQQIPKALLANFLKRGERGSTTLHLPLKTSRRGSVRRKQQG